MSEEQSSYRQILKATSIFGGVQVFNIIIGVIKSKIAALFLGAEGIGVLGLFNSTIELVRSITGLGINTSAVRDISYALGSDNIDKITDTVATVRRLCLITGVIGMIVMMLFAPMLSKWTFNNYEYTWSFMFLSVIPFLSAVSLGQLAVLQGFRKLAYLAKANLYGGLCSLFFLIPLYWCFGISGIVPLLIISAIITLFFSFYFARKIVIENVYQTLKETYSKGIGMIRLGVMLTLSSFVGTSVAYAIRVYISNESGLAEVGLYTAAYSLVGAYVGMVFTAMGTDFFPRLSAVSDENKVMEDLINNQAEVAVLILAPLINLFILFAPYLLILLYSEKFTSATLMLQWSMLGVLLQAASWPLAFTLLAKAQNRVYFFKEIGSGAYYLIFSILGYNFWGITGLGLGFIFTYVCNLIQISLINRMLYGIKLRKGFFLIFMSQALISIFLFLIIQNINNLWYIYGIGVILIFLSVIVSYKYLNKKTNLKKILISKIKQR